MDEETKATFAEVNTRLDEVNTRLDLMMARMNDGFERMIEEITAMKTDAHNSKAFLLEDAIATGRRMLSIEDRLSKLERKSDN